MQTLSFSFRLRLAVLLAMRVSFLFLLPPVFAAAGDLELEATRSIPVPGWGAPQAQFGESVAVSGDLALVADRLGGLASLHVFRRIGQEWVRQPGMGMVLGQGWVQSMDFDGNRAIVGVHPPASDLARGGMVYILRLDPGTQRWEVEYGSGIEGNHRYWGASVSIDGHYAVVGMFEPAPGAAFPLRYHHQNTPGWTRLPALEAGQQAQEFGVSVSLRQGRLAVGDSSAENFRGRVRVWESHAWDWVFRQQIDLPESSAEQALFGYNIALHGEVDAQGQISHRLLIGAPFDKTPTGPSRMGRAYLHAWPVGASSFTQIDTLVAPSPAADDYFGNGVAMDGDYALIAAPLRQVGGHPRRGTVFASRVSWSGFVGAPSAIVDPQGKTEDRLGTRLAISHSVDGPRWAIGSPRADAHGNASQGIVLLGTGTVANPLPGAVSRVDLGQGLHLAHFGTTLSARGNALVASAPDQAFGDQHRQGAVYHFPDFADTSTPPQRILSPEGAALDRFGAVLAHNERVLAIGAQRTEQGVGYAGAVYLYRRAPDGTWVFDAKLSDPEPQDYGHFGRSLAVLDDDSVLVVSARPPVLARYARVEAGLWTRTQSLPALAQHEAVGRIAVDGSRVAFAEMFHGTADAESLGAVRMFELQGDTLVGPTAQFIGTQANQMFGGSVSIDGDRLAILSWAWDEGLDKGRVQTYRQLPSKAWLPEAGFTVQSLVRPPGTQGLAAVALNGDTLVVSSLTHQATPDIRGGLFVYRFDGSAWQHRQTLGADELGSTQQTSGIEALAWRDGALFVGAHARNVAFERQGVVHALRAPGDELFADGFE